MPAAPHTAEPTSQPDPRQDQAAARTLRLLSLVRTLIAFGTKLADTIRGHNTSEAPFDTAVRFGTKDIALILSRLTRGLRLAAALETKLVERVAHPLPLRPARTSSLRKPRTKPPGPQPDRTAVPTAEEIAEQLRRRPVHAVLIDICSDLGILTGDPMWRELSRALIENGGSLVTFFKDVRKRARLTNFYPPDMPFDWRALLQLITPHQPPTAVAAATGPP